MSPPVRLASGGRYEACGVPVARSPWHADGYMNEMPSVSGPAMKLFSPPCLCPCVQSATRPPSSDRNAVVARKNREKEKKRVVPQAPGAYLVSSTIMSENIRNCSILLYYNNGPYIYGQIGTLVPGIFNLSLCSVWSSVFCLPQTVRGMQEARTNLLFTCCWGCWWTIQS